MFSGGFTEFLICHYYAQNKFWEHQKIQLACKETAKIDADASPKKTISYKLVLALSKTAGLYRASNNGLDKFIWVY